MEYTLSYKVASLDDTCGDKQSFYSDLTVSPPQRLWEDKKRIRRILQNKEAQVLWNNPKEPSSWA